MMILVAGENDVSYGKFLGYVLASCILAHHLPVLTYIDYLVLPFFTSFYLWTQTTESRFLRSISGPRDDSEVGTLGCQERQGAAGTEEGVFPRAERLGGMVMWTLYELDGSFNVFVLCLLNGFNRFIYTYNYVYIYIYL